MFADAEAYERFMGRWSRLLAPMLVEFAGIPERGRALDVGSGTGSLAFAIAEARPHAEVIGIDPSKEYVGHAASRNRFGGRVNFEAGDAQQMRFGDAAFDASVSLLVFNFIPDRKKALAEARRVTKPGGPVAAAVWDYGGEMKMLRVFWDAAVAMDPAAGKLEERHMPLCRPGELTALWKDGGLERIEERPLDIAMQFASFDDYWEPFLLGQGPAGAYVRRLDATRRDKLRDELRRRIGGRLSMTGRAWAVRGVVPGRQ
jgi:SAM-dependent methyltransferase